MIDIFSLRKIIEPEVARLASENAGAAEVEDLERILQGQGKELACEGNQIQADIHFHRLLVQMVKNRVLERLLLALFAKTRETHLQSEERKLKSLQGHQDIFAAIQSGNGRAARRAMRRHLEDVEGILFKREREGGKRL